MKNLLEDSVEELLQDAEQRLQNGVKGKCCISALPKTYNQTTLKEVDDGPAGLRRPAKEVLKSKANSDDAGPNWFHLPKATVTPELKRQWQLLRMRNLLDPKNRKRGITAQIPEFAHVGRTIDDKDTLGRFGARKGGETLIGQVITHERHSKKFQTRYAKLQSANASGGKAFYRQQQARRRKSA